MTEFKNDSLAFSGGMDFKDGGLAFTDTGREWKRKEGRGKAAGSMPHVNLFHGIKAAYAGGIFHSRDPVWKGYSGVRRDLSEGINGSGMGYRISMGFENDGRMNITGNGRMTRNRDPSAHNKSTAYGAGSRNGSADRYEKSRVSGVDAGIRREAANAQNIRMREASGNDACRDYLRDADASGNCENGSFGRDMERYEDIFGNGGRGAQEGFYTPSGHTRKAGTYTDPYRMHQNRHNGYSVSVRIPDTGMDRNVHMDQSDRTAAGSERGNYKRANDSFHGTGKKRRAASAGIQNNGVQKSPGSSGDVKNKEKNRSAGKGKDPGIRKAAARTAVGKILGRRGMFSDGSPISGDAFDDGNTGIVRIVTDIINPATYLKSLFVKIAAAVAPNILIILMILLLSAILIPVIAGMFISIENVTGNVTTFISQFSGRGRIISEGSLSEEEIERIVSESGADERGAQVLYYALSKVGYPYSQTGRAGGSAYDCSSLAFYAWQAAGVDISYGEGYPPTAASEASKIYSMGTPVSTTTVTDNDLKPGDLIFYGGHENGRFLGIYHVAIYAGNGEVVEALNEEHGVVYETLRTNNMILVLRP